MSFDLFEYAERLRNAEVHVNADPATGLRAIVAIHSTRLGPAVGGCRCLPYTSTAAALEDAIRLARGMSYKAAISDLAMGGGKAVIMRPAEIVDRQALFEAFGSFVESLGGRYITAKDSGTNVADMDVIASRTRHVTSTSAARGGPGDPSPDTAVGVRSAIEAAVRWTLGRDDLREVHVAIQGVGAVGYHLAAELAPRGARLSVADTDPARTERCATDFGAERVDPDAIYDLPCDVLAPCALGGVIDDDTVERLRCRIVCGGANNQLAEPRHGLRLHERDVFYVPDYAANAGGVIQISLHHAGSPRDAIYRRLEGVHDTILEIARYTREHGIAPSEAAERLAELRLYG